MFFFCDYACAISFFSYNTRMTATNSNFSFELDSCLKDGDTVVFEYSAGKSAITGEEEIIEYEGEVTMHDPEIHEDDCPDEHVYILCPAISGFEGTEEFPFGMPVHHDDINEIVPEDDPRHSSARYDKGFFKETFRQGIRENI